MVRQVDCVTVKGSNKPVGLYTYDVDVDGLDNLRLSQQKTVSAVEWAEAPCGREGGVLLEELLTAAAGPPPARSVSTRGARLSACLPFCRAAAAPALQQRRLRVQRRGGGGCGGGRGRRGQPAHRHFCG